MKHVKIFRYIYILAIFIGPYMTVKAVWTIADIFNGLMALPNMIALFALKGKLLLWKQKISLNDINEARSNNAYEMLGNAMQTLQTRRKKLEEE